MKIPVPYYANQSSTSLPYNNGYTITQTGFARIFAKGWNVSQAHTLKIYINGKVCWSNSQEAAAPNGARVVVADFIVPVAAGDIITITGEQSSNDRACYQIPVRWA